MTMTVIWGLMERISETKASSSISLVSSFLKKFGTSMNANLILRLSLSSKSQPALVFGLLRTLSENYKKLKLQTCFFQNWDQIDIDCECHLSKDLTWFFSVWIFSLGPNFPVFLPCIPAMNRIVELSIPRVNFFQWSMKYVRTFLSLISLLQVKTASLSASTIGWSILKVAITFTVDVSHLSRNVITVSWVDTW